MTGRLQYDLVPAGHTYDFEIDTGAHSPEACPQQLLDFLRAEPRPTAFQRLLHA